MQQKDGNNKNKKPSVALADLYHMIKKTAKQAFAKCSLVLGIGFILSYFV